MSVEKMEKYKEYKKNRKEILRKQKRKAKIQSIVGIATTAIILGIIVFCIYSDLKPENKKDYRTLINWDQYLPQDILDSEDETDEADTDAAETDEAKDADAKEGTEDAKAEEGSDTTDANN